MVLKAVSRDGKRQVGFTLVELTLTVGLILGLAGVVIVNFGSLNRTARLEEGATQVESLLRYARAQAASTGKQVRLVFGEGASQGGAGLAATNSTVTTTNAGLQALWEPDPVGAPGKFETLQGATMLVDQVNDLVRVCGVGQPGTYANEVASGGFTSMSSLTNASSNLQPDAKDQGAVAAPPTVICYPDGSSDSAEIVLSPLDDEDARLAVVTLSGTTGSLRHRIVLVASAAGSTPPEVAQPPMAVGASDR
jgi:type II secretory pathway pseudopilin PulG